MSQTSAAGTGPEQKRRKVVIVDDDRETREMLTLALELEGYDVEQAANGLRLISSLHVDRPDLILLDVMMSWIDGFELCRSIKKNDEFRDIPVVFVSARKTGEDVQKGLAAGAADYFTKPVDIDRLTHRIREILAAAA
ncbi:MAG: response regulator [Deltaproteobacteria bacterium]|nr:response regulator [Deltaproteobacteria bacterium]